ncbi:MAG: glycerophosphodiester phosphodiesterase [Thermoflexales bacterium]|nr:glycerophosphodiester phosphodiesterase [Thermoflexales bacterium]
MASLTQPKRPRRGLRALVVGLAGLGAVYAAFALTSRPAAPHPWFARRPGDRRILVFAHQGGEGVWPSNTMLGFERSAALGAEVLDTDMHLTRDGALVLMHDQTVDRTTNGTGAIRDLSLAELQRLDAGYRFSLDEGKTFPFRGQGHVAPTLESLFQRWPDKRFGIEIKQTPVEIAGPFCALIRKYGMQDKVLVSSFRQENMNAFRIACPEVATSATQDEVTLFFALNTVGLTYAYTPNYQSLQVPETFGGLTVLTPQFMAGARNRGLAVQPWTINDPEQMARVIALGVDGINTDFPQRLIEMLPHSP